MSLPASTDNPWVRPWNPRPHARIQLLCLHPAGAGASFYQDWSAALPLDVELLAVQLPGRESRFVEPLLEDYEQAVAATYAALRPYLARPYALFGHSMGALLAYGVALAARRHGDPAPARLFVSGAAGPGVPRDNTGRPGWTDDELVAELVRLGGTPKEVLAHAELLNLLLPLLRADFTLCDSFEASPAFTVGAEPPLDCPVSILGGDEDERTAAELAHWSAVTSGGSTQRAFPGGHFFLRDPSGPAVRAAVAADLAARRDPKDRP
ncbi:thioesterase II family protein [Streptacidiphilus sp. P02-A3a]|uniref:thioesterase II family protein n=1 Tax=Streptacidiphilus sp. P02-A3a TaxID=2704468 RepID=UPI0015F7C4BC|nr:alpha/beta fold hydrolase [Streptacidiphilus sp. P02-A3a]QMU70586.1 thioesterase [Streptacidiphilus sp. P02-A3a]